MYLISLHLTKSDSFKEPASLLPTKTAAGGVLEAGRVQQQDGGGGRAGRADRTVDEADKAGQQLRVEGDGQSGEVARHQRLLLLLSSHSGRGSGVAGGGSGGTAAGGRETWAQSDITPLKPCTSIFRQATSRHFETDVPAFHYLLQTAHYLIVFICSFVTNMKLQYR